jgi:sulfur-carrier protein
MSRVVLTSHLKRYVECEPGEVKGGTVSEVLEAIFSESPQLRGYILDDQGHLRQHVVIFVDGQIISDRVGLSDRVEEQSEIYIMQALSGG